MNRMRPQDTLAKRLKRLREEWGEKRGKRLRQEDLAELAGVNRSAVADWERGARTPTLENLQALASIFSLTVCDLIEGLPDLGANGNNPVDSNWEWHPEELTDSPAILLIAEVEREIDPDTRPADYLSELYRRAFAVPIAQDQLPVLDNRRAALYRKSAWK